MSDTTGIQKCDLCERWPRVPDERWGGIYCAFHNRVMQWWSDSYTTEGHEIEGRKVLAFLSGVRDRLRVWWLVETFYAIREGGPFHFWPWDALARAWCRWRGHAAMPVATSAFVLCVDCKPLAEIFECEGCGAGRDIRDLSDDGYCATCVAAPSDSAPAGRIVRAVVVSETGVAPEHGNLTSGAHFANVITAAPADPQPETPHACGDPNCIVPHPPAGKKPPTKWNK
jgi:hypothetical protein